MRRHIFDLRHFKTQEFLDFGQVGDARYDEKALPAAVMFAEQRFAQHHGIPRHDISPHGQAIDGRRLNDRQVAKARHCHLQRARDGRRGQGQHMHVGFQRFELFLVRDAKALFLIDDHQPEPLEADRFRKHRVGADDDIHRAVGQPFARG